MADADGTVGWYAPDPRTIFDLDRFHIPRRLARTVRKGLFDIRFNHDFEAVMRKCAEPDVGREETWISEELVRVYCQMHALGKAHSVECWSDGELAGGLYGVALGGAFMGESMFSRKTDASKVALVHLVTRMRERGFVLLDTQFMTPHLASLGASSIPLTEYLQRLSRALRLPCRLD